MSGITNHFAKGEWAKLLFIARGGGHVHVKIFTPFFWPKFTFVTYIAQKKAHFLAYLHYFFQMAVYVRRFWVVFPGEFTQIVENAIKGKKCTRTHALLGTWIKFYSRKYAKMTRDK